MIHYKFVREQDSNKLEVYVDFDSRYVFEDKVDMVITIETADKNMKIEEFELEKTKRQVFEVNLDQIGNKIDDKDTKVTCELGVYNVEYNAKNIGSEAYFHSSARPHDVILLIGDTKFYYIATWSKYFNTLFFGEFVEKDAKEFKIEDVDAKEFTVLLHIIHPSLMVRIDDYNVLFLLKLAVCFEMPSVVSMCGTYLSDFNNRPSVSLMQRLELADKHNISHLQVAVLKKIHSKNGHNLKAFLDKYRDRIKNLSDGTI